MQDPKKIKPELFEKLELRVGKIKGIKKAKKKYVLLIDLGKAERDVQSVVFLPHTIKELLGKYVVVILNIQSQVINGVESTAMIILGESQGKPILLQPDKKTKLGSRLYGMMSKTHTFKNTIGR
jgi:tRNA-binding EMAP/Myf-like protein